MSVAAISCSRPVSIPVPSLLFPTEVQVLRAFPGLLHLGRPPFTGIYRQHFVARAQVGASSLKAGLHMPAIGSHIIGWLTYGGNWAPYYRQALTSPNVERK